VVLKVGIVNKAIEVFPIIIVNLALAMELIVIPLSVIGKLIIIIVELATPVHEVVFPFALVESTIFVVKSSIAFSLVVMEETFIFAAIFI
jgi:hypothetical protein